MWKKPSRALSGSGLMSKANAKPVRQRAKCEAAGAPSCTPRSGFVQQDGAGNSRRALPFPSFCVLHTFFLSASVAPGGCA